MFTYLVVDDFRIKAHGSDVEGVAVNQPWRICVHDVNGSLKGIRHVHHIHEGSLCDRADKLFTFNCSVVNLYCVVGGAAAGKGGVGDEARETHCTGIYTVFVKVIVTEKFGCNLGNAVHWAGPLDGVLGSINTGSIGTEGTDRTGGEHCTAFFTCYLKNIDEAVHLDVPGKEGLFLCHCRKQGCKVVYGVNLVFFNYICQTLGVADVSLCAGTAFQKDALGLCALDKTCYDIAFRV